jgi:heat shock protein HslJ
VGTCVDIGWRTGGGTALVQLKRDGTLILDNAPLEGTVQDCSLSQPGTVLFRVEASNNAGQAVFQEEPVTVSETPPDNPLAGTGWLLQDTLENSTISASFGVDGSLNGSAGCNSYSAQYIASGQTLAITPPSSSQTICAEPEGIMEQEARYLTTLSQAATFQISDNILIIADNVGQPIMRFNQLQATPLQ